LNFLKKGGVAQDRMCIDPGIGFGKLFTHNFNLLRLLSAFTNLQQLMLLGTSNKSFIGQALARDVEHRLAGSLATQIMGWLKGATIFRVHDVKATKDSLEIARLYSDG
jgi:dihydropteroate synthase